MAKRPGQKITMTSIDELLCVPDTEGTIDIDVEAIYPFENHPFKVLDDERMEELTESIRTSGVLTPVLVRPDDEGTYEMISGHRRLRAAKRAGLRKIPAIIKEMTDDEATIAMVDGNIQREEILPSEKAFAFKMKLDAIKRQGKRSDLTSAHNERRLEAADIVGEESGCSHAQVRRYVRLISSADRDVGLDEYTAYAEIIKENLDWEILCDRYPYDRELLEGIYDLILETVLCKSGTVLIARNEYPVQLVKSKFLKLHSGHIEYVVDCLKGNTSKVRNIKKYLLAALFNAPTTISGYYQAEVNHDIFSGKCIGC